MGPEAAREGRSSRIVVLTAGGFLGWTVVNGLISQLGPVVVIEEAPERKADIIKRRLRLGGPVATVGQVAFGVWQRMAAKRAETRIAEIRAKYGLDPNPRDGIAVYRVGSHNSEEARALLRKLDPDVVAVYGTRMLSRATLGAIDVPFINYHAGINPKYRGQHPAYWALAAGDKDNAGVTVHLVDAGVDTGGVLYQERVVFEPADTISTYQTLQAVTGVSLFARALEDAICGRLQTVEVDMASRNYLPPTIWRYCWNGLARGVW